MKEISYNFVDKSQWPRGRWDDEPDKMQWRDAATGLPCLIVRNSSGALCGYVGVSVCHPCYGMHYDDVHDLPYDVRVHGGLTFASKCRPGPENQAICHLVEDGEDDNVWWLGFDCAHSDDYCPGMASHLPPFMLNGEYRNLRYVQTECAQLAFQLSEINL